ncbi:MAG: DNA methyltransferase [Armatimonadota bacterium]|nr:DNA methyltransferase [Armatimonadota bacterium]
MRLDILHVDGLEVPVFINEYWTSGQRQASSIHEVSYRACYKPQLPRFFIELLTEPGDTVYDPFGGRGTTAIEAALMGRGAISNDANPLSETLARPRFHPPTPAQVKERLNAIPQRPGGRADFDLSMFFHPDTEAEIVSLRDYLKARRADGTEDHLDRWIRMVATNRLTGHSPGFFSVYTLPPNQAVTPDRQIKINKKRNQTPEHRDTTKIIVRKTHSLVKELTESQKDSLRRRGETAVFLCADARRTDAIPDNSVALTVTSPPFLNVVQYADDNWLRCWFNDIDVDDVAGRITMARGVEEWSRFTGDVFRELHRVTKPGGWVAYEVGEVKAGKVKLEEHVVPAGLSAGFHCVAVLINEQSFTKTANIWGVSNNSKGTNTNRIVLFSK